MCVCVCVEYVSYHERHPDTECSQCNGNFGIQEDKSSVSNLIETVSGFLYLVWGSVGVVKEL